MSCVGIHGGHLCERVKSEDSRFVNMLCNNSGI